MPEADPTTQTMTVNDAQEQWGTMIDAVSSGRSRVVLEQAGVPVAALVSRADFERLRRYDAQREADFAVIDRMRAAFADVPDQELEREIDRAVAEARAELRAEREQAARQV